MLLDTALRAATALAQLLQARHGFTTAETAAQRDATTAALISAGEQLRQAGEQLRQAGEEIDGFFRLALTDANVTVELKIASLLRGMLRDAHLTRISLPRSAINAYQRQVRQDGPSFDDAQLLSSLGGSRSYAYAWAKQEAAARIPSTINLPGLLN